MYKRGKKMEIGQKICSMLDEGHMWTMLSSQKIALLQTLIQEDSIPCRKIFTCSKNRKKSLC